MKMKSTAVLSSATVLLLVLAACGDASSGSKTPAVRRVFKSSSEANATKTIIKEIPSKDLKWEYRIVALDGEDGVLTSNTLDRSEAIMRNLGRQGWELVSSFPIVRTKMKDVSMKQLGYVSNIRADIRTTAVSYIFKRRIYSRKNQ